MKLKIAQRSIRFGLTRTSAGKKDADHETKH
jgi:hypothetical protein